MHRKGKISAFFWDSLVFSARLDQHSSHNTDCVFWWFKAHWYHLLVSFSSLYFCTKGITVGGDSIKKGGGDKMKSAIDLSDFIYYSVETMTVFIKETGMDLKCFYKVSYSIIKVQLYSQSLVPMDPIYASCSSHTETHLCRAQPRNDIVIEQSNQTSGLYFLTSYRQNLNRLKV